MVLVAGTKSDKPFPSAKARAVPSGDQAGISAPAKLCTNRCDYRDFNQFRAGITDEEGNWNGQQILLITSDTLPLTVDKLFV